MSKHQNTLFFVRSSAEAFEIARNYLKVQPGADYDFLDGDSPERCGLKFPLWLRVTKVLGRAARLEFFTEQQVHDQLSQVRPKCEAEVEFQKSSDGFLHIDRNLFSVRDYAGLRAAAIAYCVMCHDDSKFVTIDPNDVPDDKDFPCIVSLRAIGRGTVVVNSFTQSESMKVALKTLKKWETK